MSTLYVLSTGALSNQQVAEAKKVLGVWEIVPAPSHVYNTWNNPIKKQMDTEILQDYLYPVFEWVDSFHPKARFVIEGDDSISTFLVVSKALKKVRCFATNHVGGFREYPNPIT